MVMQDQDEFLKSLRKDFLEEASFLIDDTEEIMLTLEKEENKADQLAQLFRIVHTIKGSGGAVGFELLVKMAHVFEDYLALLRVTPERVTTDAISKMLKSVDCLKEGLKAHKNSQPEGWKFGDVKQESDHAERHNRLCSCSIVPCAGVVMRYLGHLSRSTVLGKIGARRWMVESAAQVTTWAEEGREG